LDNVPTLVGPEGAADAIELIEAGLPSGVTVAWAMTTGAALVAANPSVELFDAC
jgi:hypothetical protein